MFMMLMTNIMGNIKDDINDDINDYGKNNVKGVVS